MKKRIACECCPVVDERNELKEELALANNKVKRLRNRNAELDEKLSESDAVQLSIVKAQLAQKKRQLAEVKDQLHDKNVLISKLIDEIDKLQHRKSSGPDNVIWDHAEILDCMEKNEYEDIRFKSCGNEYGEFLDARIYCNDKPTRRGICLDIDTFSRFVSKCQKVLTIIRRS